MKKLKNSMPDVKSRNHRRAPTLGRQNAAFELDLSGFRELAAATARTGEKLSAAWFRRQLLRLLHIENIRTGFWSVRLVNASQMAALHRQTMNLNSPTDVLTFDLSGGVVAQGHLELDTVVCLDVARKQSALCGHSVSHELLLYLIHSLLHVRGFNDVRKADAARMHQREDDLLTILGFGPLFSTGPKAAPSAGRFPPAGAVRRNGRRGGAQ